MTVVVDYLDNIVIDKEKFEGEVIPTLKKYKHIVFDLETTGLSFLRDKIVGIGIGTLDDELTKLTSVYYIPVEYHEGMENLFPMSGGEVLKRDYVFPLLAPIFLDFEKIIIAHNLKFDMQFLLNEGIDLREKLCLPRWNIPKGSTEDITQYIESLPKKASCADTMIMSWLLDENRKSHNLKDLATELLNLDMTKLDKILKKKLFHEADAELTFPYAVKDIESTGKLYLRFIKQLNEEKLDQVFWYVEMPFVGVLQGIERRGMPINKEVIMAIGERCKKRMEEIIHEVHTIAGKEFNIESGVQLAKVLHEELGLPILARTPKGAIKVDQATLEKILIVADQHKDQLKERHYRGLEIIKLVLEFRKLTKTYGTYVEGILEKIEIDDRIHTSFHHTGTVTGRLSSSNPNMQNLPSKPIFIDRITKEEFEKEVGHIIHDPNLSDIEKEIAIQKHFPFTIVPVKKNEKGNYEECGHEEAEMYEIRWKIRDAFQENKRDWWLVVSDLALGLGHYKPL